MPCILIAKKDQEANLKELRASVLLWPAFNPPTPSTSTFTIVPPGLFHAIQTEFRMSNGLNITTVPQCFVFFLNVLQTHERLGHCHCTPANFKSSTFNLNTKFSYNDVYGYYKVFFEQDGKEHAACKSHCGTVCNQAMLAVRKQYLHSRH